MMTQRKIRISTIAEAKDFVARASECDFDINIFYTVSIFIFFLHTRNLKFYFSFHYNSSYFIP